MKPPAQIAVVIVSYNTRELLLAALASVIESAPGEPVELVVVDNHSTDGSAAAARRAFPQVTVIENAENLGFGAACNQAIRVTRSPLILLLNSDARLTPEALAALTECMRMNHRCGAAGCRMLDDAGRETVNTRNFLTPFNQVMEWAGITAGFGPRRLRRTRRPQLGKNLIDCSVDWIDGACLLLRRAALDEVGLFDEQFFMYSEDEDLCLRLRKGGWAVCYTAAGTALHRGGASSARARREMLRWFYYSQMLFLLKHRSRRAVFLYQAAMKTMLLLKQLTRPTRRAEISERLAALAQAFQDIPR
ncbi:MAG TPA: glycosyltransferase family 2 protein [Blastocatellia bacterium]|nr:glycosyltransferase family 2 protein [Blastocatellia bacterium]